MNIYNVYALASLVVKDAKAIAKNSCLVLIISMSFLYNEDVQGNKCYLDDTEYCTKHFIVV